MALLFSSSYFRFGYSILVGICVNLFGRLLPIHWTWFGLCSYAFLMFVYAMCLAVLSWPLLSFKVAAYVSLGTAIGSSLVGVVWDIYLLEMGIIRRWWVIPLVLPVTLIILWGLGWAFLALSTFVRRRYWPIWPPGNCRFCGYNLFGLPSSRCPECGNKNQERLEENLEMNSFP